MVYIDKELKKLAKDAGKDGKDKFAAKARTVVRGAAGMLKRVIRLGNKESKLSTPAVVQDLLRCMDADEGAFRRDHLGPEALLMLTELLQERRHRQEILAREGSAKVNGGKSQGPYSIEEKNQD